MTGNRTKRGDYKVGYGRPPKSGQFKPGQSGNPAGRPKLRKTAHDFLIEEALRRVRVKTGDKVINIERQSALMRRLFDLGLQGDIAAIRLILTHLHTAQMAAEQNPPAPPLSDDELAVWLLLSGSKEEKNG